MAQPSYLVETIQDLHPSFPMDILNILELTATRKKTKGKWINPQKILLKGLSVFFEAHSLNRDLHQKARLVTYTSILLINHRYMSNFQTIHKKIKTLICFYIQKDKKVCDTFSSKTEHIIASTTIIVNIVSLLPAPKEYLWGHLPEKKMSNYSFFFFS